MARRTGGLPGVHTTPRRSGSSRALMPRQVDVTRHRSVGMSWKVMCTSFVHTETVQPLMLTDHFAPSCMMFGCGTSGTLHDARVRDVWDVWGTAQ